MEYKNAQDILPDNLISEIQKYTSGKLIYIPKPKHNRIGQGELSGGRDYINKKNIAIKKRYKKRRWNRASCA